MITALEDFYLLGLNPLHNVAGSGLIHEGGWVSQRGDPRYEMLPHIRLIASPPPILPRS